MPRLLPQLPRAVYTQSVQVLMITPSVQWSMVTLTLLGIVLPLEGKKKHDLLLGTYCSDRRLIPGPTSPQCAAASPPPPVSLPD